MNVSRYLVIPLNRISISDEKMKSIELIVIR